MAWLASASLAFGALTPAAGIALSLQNFLGTAPEPTTLALLTQHPWPLKNGNVLRSGQTLQAPQGARNLSQTSWTFEADKVESFYQSPLIDRDGNAIFGVLNDGFAKYYSVAPSGETKWEARLNFTKGEWAGQPPTAALFGDAMYTTDGQGSILSISLTSGQELWRRRYAHSSGMDAWSMGIDPTSGTLFSVAYEEPEEMNRCFYGGTALYAHSLHDGQVRWKFPFDVCNCNIMPAVNGDTVYFGDCEGGGYALDIATGKPRWHQSGIPKSYTTSAPVIGGGLLLIPANRLGMLGGSLRALDLETGVQRWRRTFKRSTTAGGAVFRDGHGRLVVALGVSDNPGGPPLFPALDTHLPFPGSVFALDVETGEEIWEFKTPVWRHQMAAGSTTQRVCLPDAFTNPAVDGDGIVYIGWAGGVLFAINGTDGSEVSRHDLGSGMQGAPAIGHGSVVASSCHRMAAFASAQQP